MSDSTSFESTPSTIIDIIKEIDNKIKLFYLIYSSSSYTIVQWTAFESLLNPQNKLFTDYLLEHRAFTLNQIIKGSTFSRCQCEYIINKLVDGGILILHRHAKGFTRPFNIYLLRGEDLIYVDQALKLHLDSFGSVGQLSLDDSFLEDSNWVNIYVENLKKRHVDRMKRRFIVADFITHNGGKYDKKKALEAVEAVKKAGVQVIY